MNRIKELRHRLTMKFIGGRVPSRREMPEVERIRAELAELESRTRQDISWCKYWGNDYGPETHPGLNVLLSHSDCDGKISPDDCVKVADELEALLPKITGDGGGHIAAQGGFAEVARKFIEGCRLAAAEDEELVFG